ncbi:uncharacterized protein TNCV_1844041 [Trichonephila clavipes]|nr:uncharacterized protein TNCV_1844041 [Trichonephila clavipes]
MQPELQKCLPDHRERGRDADSSKGAEKERERRERCFDPSEGSRRAKGEGGSEHTRERNKGPIGTRSKGRPNLRWIDDLEKDLLVLRTKNWRTLEGRRLAWKGLLEKAKVHPGLSSHPGFEPRTCGVETRYATTQPLGFLVPNEKEKDGREERKKEQREETEKEREGKETEKERKRVGRERERGARLVWRKGLSPRLEWKDDERRWR